MKTFLAFTALAAVAASSASQAQKPLVPAGAINGVFGHRPMAILAEDDPTVVAHAEWVHDRFFKDRSRVLVGDATVEEDLRGHNLLVFGTIDGHPWLTKYRDRLPFRYGDGGVTLDREYTGNRLRVIAALRNPQDPKRRVVAYTAANAADIKGINGVFHGPTEWVIADGARVLGKGNYPTAGVLLDVAAMQADLDWLEAKLLANHPTTAEGPTPALAAALQEARAATAEPRSIADFWLTANRVALALADAHTHVAPLGSSRRLDLPLAWLADGLVVTHDTAALQRGDRLVTLQGHDETALLGALRGLIPAENDHWIRERGTPALADLAVLQLLGLAEDAPVTLTIERDGESLQVEIEPPADGAHTDDSASADAAANADWVRWTIDPDHDLAVFTLDRCVVDDHYLARLATFFAEVAESGVTRIAVDLRRNSGGNSQVCDEFLRYVDLDEYWTYSASIRSTVDANEQHGTDDELGLRHYGRQRKENDRHEGAPLFSGKLYALTSKETFSSGSWFAVVLGDNDLAEVIGEPTGGAPSSHGEILRFVLPESSFSFSVSHKAWRRPDPSRQPAHTLEPDHAVPFTREHLVEGIDPVLEFVRSHR
ncbi:MAG: S41 family peptidase [Planctomycetota bacterium]